MLVVHIKNTISVDNCKLFVIKLCGRVHDGLGAIDKIIILTINLLLKDLGLVNNSKDAAVVFLQFYKLSNPIH